MFTLTNTNILFQAVAETPVAEETPEVKEPEDKPVVEEKKEEVASSEPEEPENLRKIFAGGLNRETSDEAFKEFFSQFGSITDGVVIKDQGQSTIDFYDSILFLTFGRC